MNKQGKHLSALAGHFLDLWQLVRFDFRNPRSYSKFRHIKTIGRRTGARMMVETGTFRGVTARRCSKVFDRVFTIELDPGLVKEARQYLQDRRNVEVIEGDATIFLPQVMEKAELGDALVFLDGHFSGTSTARGDVSEPAVLEIEMLAKHRDKIRAIIVDDFRCFGTDDWPAKSDLIRSLESFFPTFTISVNLDQVTAVAPSRG